MYFGLQMFGFSRAFREDPEGFCDRILAGGFRMIEPCISFLEMFLQMGFWTPEETEGYLPMLREKGLQIPSAHVAVEDWEKDLPTLVRIAESAGIRAFVVNSPRDLSEESLRETAAELKKAAEVLKEHGVRLMIHNGAFDLERKLRGKTAYETLLDLCGGAVYAQADIGWAYAGGEDPEAFLWRNEGRVLSVHYKDMSAKKREVIPGSGVVDYVSAFQFARANGCTQIVDMDSGTPEDAISFVRELASITQVRDHTDSILCTLDVDTGELCELRCFENRIIEAPNWLRDGKTLVFNSDGRIFRYDMEADSISPIDTGDCIRCNNDHVLSADGKQLAVSCGTEEKPWISNIYVIDLEKGGAPRQITPDGFSYLHGWSPDGQWLCYCGFKFDEDGARHVEICARNVQTLEERVLTRNAGFNDGPEYSPNGRHIWFTSTRSGLMQVWRMNADGSDQVQMTDAPANNWFGHVSPDGKQVVYLSFKEGELEPHEHLANMKVSLYTMNYDGSEKRKLIDLFGGQGSINVNSWSPDSRRIAFVKYVLRHK